MLIPVLSTPSVTVRAEQVTVILDCRKLLYSQLPCVIPVQATAAPGVSKLQWRYSMLIPVLCTPSVTEVRAEEVNVPLAR